MEAKMTSSGAEIALLIAGTLCAPCESRSCHIWPAISPIVSLAKTWRSAAASRLPLAGAEFVAPPVLLLAIGIPGLSMGRMSEVHDAPIYSDFSALQRIGRQTLTLRIRTANRLRYHCIDLLMA
jgi:hypothetical protein